MGVTPDFTAEKRYEKIFRVLANEALMQGIHELEDARQEYGRKMQEIERRAHTIMDRYEADVSTGK